MFNPFKKKDEGFKLDDYSLPSLGETSNNSGLQHGNKDTGVDMNSFSADNSFAMDLNQQSSDFGLPSSHNSSANPDLVPVAFSMDPESLNNTRTQYNSESSLNTGLHVDIAKAKLDSIESRVTLIDARLSNIEQKLELLNQIILSEVSEETKRKFKVKSMMDNIKN